MKILRQPASAVFAIVIISSAITSCSKKGNWPQFRGQESNMISTGINLPDTWGKDKNVKWTYKIKGTGWSSPVIWGDRVFISSAFPEKVKEQQQMPMGEPPGEGDKGRTGPGQNQRQEGPGERPGQVPQQGHGRPMGPPPQDTDTTFKQDIYRWEVTCVDLNTGKEIWNRVAFKGHPKVGKNPMNTYASETPATDGKRIFAYFGMTGLFCYDMNGSLLWQKDLGSFGTQQGWGTGSSPVIYNGILYLQVDNEVNSYIVALDGATGDEIWRMARQEKTNYCTPVIWKNSLRTELVAGGKTVRSYDPKTGKILWELMAGGEQCIPSPVADRRHLYIGNEGGQEKKALIYAVKAGAEGDISLKAGETTGKYIEWSTPDAGTGSGSPLLYKGLIYNIGGSGDITCINAADGKQLYRQRINGTAAVWSSPWACKDKIFFCDEKGVTRVLKAGYKFEKLAENRLNDKFWASAAIGGENYVLRGVEMLYCIGK